MTGTSAGDAPPPAVRTAARRRSAGIYGTIVASAVLAAGGAYLRTVPLAVTVLVTLLVYWAAEGYAELLSEQIHAGHLPTRAQVRASLAAIWPMVSASYVPLVVLLVARLLGATHQECGHGGTDGGDGAAGGPWLGGGQGGPAARRAIAGGDGRGHLWGHDDPAQADRHPLIGRRTGAPGELGVPGSRRGLPGRGQP